jgi:hypothetical protein
MKLPHTNKTENPLPVATDLQEVRITDASRKIMLEEMTKLAGNDPKMWLDPPSTLMDMNDKNSQRDARRNEEALR